MTKAKQQPTSKLNLAEGLIRATIILNEENLNTIKDIAYTDRKTIIAVFNEAMKQYIQRHKGKIIKRPKK